MNAESTFSYTHGLRFWMDFVSLVLSCSSCADWLCMAKDSEFIIDLSAEGRSFLNWRSICENLSLKYIRRFLES